MRGPMIANMMNQLLTETDWGCLDYLVIDMPPGKRLYWMIATTHISFKELAIFN
jgi:Mrp family chromosome partitioning ATPase